MTSIENKDPLLADVARGLSKLVKEHLARPLHARSKLDVCCIEVIFYDGKEVVLTTDLAMALDYLANDIYYDEESNWSGATRAEVRVM